jgi:hypothetical protein
MSSLFATQSKSGHQKVYLRTLSSTLESLSPIFIADCELYNCTSHERISINNTPSLVKRRVIQWHRKVPKGVDCSTLANLVYAKLLAPFSTIVCLFADDYRDAKATARVLVSWLLHLKQPSSDLPMPTYPRVIIFKRWKNMESTFDEKLATIGFEHEMRREIEAKRSRNHSRLEELEYESLLAQQVGSVRVLAIPLQPDLQEQSVLLQMKRLKARLLEESQDVQNQRRAARMAFSLTHVEAFLHTACDHFVQNIFEPFSFIRSSRIANPVPQDIAWHISRFLERTSFPLVHRLWHQHCAWTRIHQKCIVSSLNFPG